MTLTGDFVTGQTVSFQRMRALMAETALQEGVVGAADLLVVQRAAGANMSVDVGTGAAWVQIDTGTRNGLAHVYNDAVANVVVSASNGTNPRIDQIVLRYNDATIPTGSGNVPTLEVLTGTATSGATLDNRTGAASLPNDCLRLADLLIPTSSTSVTTANIRDRRPWARGYLNKQTRTTADVAGVNSASLAAAFPTELQMRVECSGAPLRLTWILNAAPTAAGNTIFTGLFLDGAAWTEVSMGTPYTATAWMPVGFSTVMVPTAGSHLICPAHRENGGSWTLVANATQPTVFVVEELVRQASNNGTT